MRGQQIADNSLTADDVVYSLDDAYDNGGAGLGRAITADAGAVVINSSSGTALELTGSLRTTTTIAATGDITGSSLRLTGNEIVSTSSTFNLINTTATTVNFASAATNLGFGNPAGTNNVLGRTKFEQGLSGSLTKLIDGTSYLIAGTRMTITTGSNGAVTVSHSGSINVTEALTIGATTTAPTKATTRVQDFIQLTDDGSGWCHVEASYFASNAAGAVAGNGNYLYTLPGGYQFNTTTHPTNTQINTMVGMAEVNKMIGATGIVSQEGNSSFNNYVVPYSSTQFRIIAHTPTQYAYLGNSYYVMTAANNQFRISFRFRKA